MTFGHDTVKPGCTFDRLTTMCEAIGYRDFGNMNDHRVSRAGSIEVSRVGSESRSMRYQLHRMSHEEHALGEPRPGFGLEPMSVLYEML
jgi:hypothetical protein